MTRIEVYLLEYKEDLNVEGKILKLVSDDGQIHCCELKGKENRQSDSERTVAEIYVPTVER